MSNILVTAVGSYSADIVIKTLKAHGHKVVGCDVYPKGWIADAYNVDVFYQVPYATEVDSYLKHIRRICDCHRIRYIIPLTDPEVDVLSREKKAFTASNICICTSDREVVQLCRNKHELAIYLAHNGVKNTIPTYLLDDNKAITYPIFLKPISGRSSIGCKIIHTDAELQQMRNAVDNDEYIVQPFIKGDVITVDVVRDPLTNTVVCVPRRELLRTVSGAGTTVEIIDSPEIESICTSIAELTGVVGAINIEFLEDSKGGLFFLEVNPRFSGGVEFTHLAGYDVVTNHLRCFMGVAIEKKSTVQKMIVARKYEEYITEYL